MTVPDFHLSGDEIGSLSDTSLDDEDEIVPTPSSLSRPEKICSNRDINKEDHGKVEKYCSKCNHFLCSMCVKAHLLTKLTRNHFLIDYKENSPNKTRKSSNNFKIEYCLKHNKVMDEKIF